MSSFSREHCTKMFWSSIRIFFFLKMSSAERQIPFVGGLISGFASVHGLKGAKVFGTEWKHKGRLK